MTLRRHPPIAISVTRGLFAFSLVVLWVLGCTSIRESGSVAREPIPTLNPRRATQPWVLIRNPHFGDVRGEPEYVWVEEDRIPTTLRTLLLGQRSIIASPEVVAKYGSPPGGGPLSRLHDGPLTAPEPGAPAPAARVSARGYVVLVKKSRIVVDLTDKDGLRPGSILSIRQPLPVVHPVTGQLLGTYEDEVATAKVIEVHGMFSVAEIQEVSPDVEIKLGDRVVPRN